VSRFENLIGFDRWLRYGDNDDASADTSEEHNNADADNQENKINTRGNHLITLCLIGVVAVLRFSISEEIQLKQRLPSASYYGHPSLQTQAIVAKQKGEVFTHINWKARGGINIYIEREKVLQRQSEREVALFSGNGKQMTVKRSSMDFKAIVFLLL
jgi:hypothetical protein